MIYQILGSGSKEFLVNLALVKSITVDTNSVTIDGVSLLKNTYTIDIEDLYAHWVVSIEEPIAHKIESWPSAKLEINWPNNTPKQELDSLINVSSSILNGFTGENKSNTDYAVFLADEIIRKGKAKKGLA